MNKEKINAILILSLIIFGIIFLVLSFFFNNLFYIGLGLLSGGFTIAIIETLKDFSQGRK